MSMDALPVVNVMCHYQEVYNGHGITTYEWKGPARGKVIITSDLLVAEPTLLDELPWLLMKIADNPLSDTAWYVRRDVYGGLWWRLVAFAMWLHQARRPLSVRIILTLHIWGLAYCPEGEPVSWKQVGKRRPRP